MTNRAYWANRAAQDMVDHMGTAEQAAAEIERAAKKAGRYLGEEVRKVFGAFEDFGISEREARILLRSCRHGSVSDRLRRIGERIQDDEKRKAFLDALNSAGAYHWRIKRIEALNEDIDSYVEAFRQLQQKTVKETLGVIARDSYYRTIYELQRETGLGFSFSTFSRREVDAILRKNWSGVNYSGRIWENTSALAARLKDELLVSAMTGRSTGKTARIIADAFGSGIYEARRLVRTESAYVAGEATDRGYEEAGIDDYIFVATLDKRTSRVCAEHDGKTYHRKDRKVGTNYPPLHPFCRSTTIASFGDDTLAGLERRARDKEGKPIKVPAGMTYKQWAEKYCPEALEKFGPDKSESDLIDNVRRGTKAVISDKRVFGYNELPEKLRNDFENGLKSSDGNTAKALKEAMNQADFAFSDSKKSYYNRKLNYVVISKDETPDTLAHELFHRIDKTKHITARNKDSFTNALNKDWQTLEKISNGKPIEYLEGLYPEAFTQNKDGEISLKKEYRGISDIISGITNDKINLGYHHKKKYWGQDNALAREAWAQFGRISYSNDADVTDFFNKVFTNFSEYATMALKEVI